MRDRRAWGALFVGAAIAGAAGCSRDSGGEPPGPGSLAGGSSGAGGTPASGGAPSTGGSPNGGHAGATGGTGAIGGSGGATGGASGSAGVGNGGASGTSASCPSGGAGGTPPAACTPAEQQAAIDAMLKAPIIPSRFAGGIDLAGNDQWPGITVEQIENGFTRVDTVGPAGPYPGGFVRLCDGQMGGATFGQMQWGPAGEIDVSFNDATHVVNAISVNPGYQGVLTAKSRDGQHTYVLPMSAQITKDGQPFDLDWTNATDPSSHIEELYDALAASFAPSFPPEANGTACAASGHCILGNFGAAYYLFVPTIGFGLVVQTITAGPVIASTPINFQLYETKLLGFSTADATLKIDADGPRAKTIAGPTMKTCELGIGTSWSDLLANCVEVTGDAAKDQRELAKLLGGMTANDEEFLPQVAGVGFSILSAKSIGATSVLATGDTPQPNDTIDSLQIDSSAIGNPTNDYVNGDTSQPFDGHGAGLVYLEFARLMEAELQKARTDVCPDPANCPAGQAPLRTIGDPACLAPNVMVSGGSAIFPQGCTGLEGVATSAAKASPPADEPYLASAELGTAALALGNGALRQGLKPGPQQVVYCAKLGATGASSCSKTSGGATGPLFTTTAQRIVDALGQGDPTKVPAFARDPFFAFEQYAKALAKYFVAAGQGTQTPDAVHAVPVDATNFTTWIAPDASFVSATYVARDLATTSATPPVFTVVAQLANDFVDQYWFGRHFLRGELAVAKMQLDHDVPDAVPGGPKGDDVLFSNVFGSPLLAEAYAGDPSCATKKDPSCPVPAPLDASGNVVLDETGQPLLARYAGAIASSGPIALGKVNVSPMSTTAGFCGQTTYVTIELPERQTPLATTPWPVEPTFVTVLPQADGATLPALDASGKPTTLATSLLDFGGTTENELAYYTSDASGVAFVGAEGRMFHGLIFLCRDGATSEWLYAKSGDPAARLTDWISAHAAAASACGLVVATDGTGAVTSIGSHQAGTIASMRGTPPRVGDVFLFDPSKTP